MEGRGPMSRGWYQEHERVRGGWGLSELLCCFREVRRSSTENEAVGEDVDVEERGEGVNQMSGKAEI